LSAEGPQHTVVLKNPLYVGVHEVTQEQYTKVIGKNPSQFTGSGVDTTSYPVEMVRWMDAARFCAKLSETEKRTPCYVFAGTKVTAQAGDGYRLPTEAEWEFACRAGTTTRFWCGETEEDVKKAGWFLTNSQRQTQPVGKLLPNPFGLFDVHGNVWEWCQDGFDRSYYSQFSTTAAIDPVCPAKGSYVHRGGDLFSAADATRSAVRSASPTSFRGRNVGFRAVLVIPKK
jgi:formylglycine-generating enzyme required for sulfatase activity